MKKLGRGLGAILEDVEAGYLKSIPNKGIQEIEVSKIKINPYQPRKHFNEEAIKELASSIQKHGLMQPVIVIENNGEYVLVAGERRLRAFKYLNKDKIRAIVSDISLNELREYALIENIQREDLNPLEVASSLKALIEEHGYTHEELAKNIGKSRSYITNLLRLLSLPEKAKNKLLENKISFGHAKILAGVEEEKINQILDIIESKSLSVRETEQLIRNQKNSKKSKKDEYEINNSILDLAKKLKEKGFKIEIGKDFLKIKFRNETDLKKLKEISDKID